MPAVGYDNQASITGTGVTSLDVTITVGSNADRAAIIGLSMDGAAGSGITYTLGGVAAVAIPGTFSSNVLTAAVTAPPSGSQTAHSQWTGAANAVLGVLTFYNVNQNTPTNNGTVSASAGTGTTSSITVTSNSGDLTVDHCFVTARTLSANTQNLGYNTANGALVAGGSTYGPGTGTSTHQWTLSAGSGGRSDGVNMVQQDDLMPQAVL